MDETKSTTVEEAASGGISSPDLDPQTLVAGNKSLKDAAQAWAVFENLRTSQQTRNGINARIVENCNGKAPYGEDEIAAWQSNFSSLFLSGIIDKIVPVLVGYIENAKSITQSRIKDQSQAGQEKTAQLRELFTSTARQWAGWRPFWSSLCQELILIGYTYAARTDEYDWRPRHWRQDKAFVPEGSSQFAEHVQVFAAQQDFLIHELTDIIKDTEEAKAAKWNVDNCVDALNAAMPQDPNADSDATNARAWVDVVQEGNLGMSHRTGAKVVEAAHVMVVETGDKGKITHVILDRNAEHKALLWHESRFDSMRDVLTLFTLDPGNGNFYGSRGVGRRIVNYDVAMNAVLNDAVDLNRLLGLIVLQQDLAKGTPPPRVKKPFLWINKDSVVVAQKPGLQVNVKAAVELMNKLGELAEVATQQYIPNTNPVEGRGAQGHPTAHQVAIDYQREQQSVAAFIGRFAGQVAELVGMMQRAMCNPDTNDEAAMEFRKRALGNEKEGIPAIVTEAELKEFALSPAAEVLQDLTMMEAQAKLAAANDPEVMQSANIDHKARLEMKLSAMLPKPLVDSLLKKDAIDPNDEAEQFGLQVGETHDIMMGAPGVPVSGRHNDKVHLDVLLPDLMKGVAGLEQMIAEHPPLVTQPQVGEQLDHFHTGMVHCEKHVESWEKKTPADPELPKYAQAVEEGRKRLEMLSQELIKLKKQVEQAQQKAQQEQQQQPPPPAGAPAPGAPPTADGEPVPTGGPLPMTEKIATAWIAQYTELPLPERRRLEEMAGGLTTPALAAADEVEKQKKMGDLIASAHAAEPPPEPETTEPVSEPPEPTGEGFPPPPPAPPSRPAPPSPAPPGQVSGADLPPLQPPPAE